MKEQPLDESVKIVKTIDDNKRRGSTLLTSSISVEHQDLPKVLTPEILWGRQNLIDFQSPIECDNTTSAHKLGNPSNQTIGLSMDPLKSGSFVAVNFTRCGPFNRPQITDLSPINASTPVSGSTSITSGSVDTTLQVSSLP